MASNNANRTSLNSENGNKEGSSTASGTSSAHTFECNICLETAKDAVVSRCGHLFCWPCLHQWLETIPDRQICPVCKAAVSRETVVPLYSGGNQQDPRDKVPPRPQAHREEADERPQNYPYGAHGGFQMSFGMGAFPFFPMFGTTLSYGPAAHHAHPLHQMAGEGQRATMEQLFLGIAIVCIVYMLFFV